MSEQIVIVGAGQAAVQAIDTLRRKGFTGKLIAAGDEPWPAYQRPPLSKKYLSGTLDRDRLAIRPCLPSTRSGTWSSGWGASRDSLRDSV